MVGEGSLFPFASSVTPNVTSYLRSFLHPFSRQRRLLRCHSLRSTSKKQGLLPWTRTARAVCISRTIAVWSLWLSPGQLPPTVTLSSCPLLADMCRKMLARTSSFRGEFFHQSPFRGLSLHTVKDRLSLSLSNSSAWRLGVLPHVALSFVDPPSVFHRPSSLRMGDLFVRFFICWVVYRRYGSNRLSSRSFKQPSRNAGLPRDLKRAPCERTD